jgi:hypothetical protein
MFYINDPPGPRFSARCLFSGSQPSSPDGQRAIYVPHWSVQAVELHLMASPTRLFGLFRGLLVTLPPGSCGITHIREQHAE